jgi:hypothetical protein
LKINHLATLVGRNKTRKSVADLHVVVVAREADLGVGRLRGQPGVAGHFRKEALASRRPRREGGALARIRGLVFPGESMLGLF